MPSTAVVTRFAPSPTGYLHSGGEGTALLNWLYARNHGGRFLLRIEDTDRKRSTQPAIDAILDGMAWLGLDADEPPVFQFERAGRHAEVAHEMVAQGHAYRCYLTADELAAMRAAAEATKKPLRIRSPWRDRDAAEAPADVEQVKVATRRVGDGDDIVMDRRAAIGGVLEQVMMRRFPGGDVDPRRCGDRPDGGDGIQVAIAPGFILARGKGKAGHHAAATSA